MADATLGVSVAALAPSLVVIDGHITTTSNQVADHFGKIHRDVVRAIENLECSENFRLRNFAQSSFDAQLPNGGTRSHKSYRITRDGFTFLAMGFTGREAAQWKEAYIGAFNRMEAELLARHESDLRRQLAEAQKLIPHTINPAQKRSIQKLAAEIAYAAPADTTAKEFKRVYTALNDQFGISAYGELPAAQYDEAVQFLRSLSNRPLQPVTQTVQSGTFLNREQVLALQHHLDLCWNLASRARHDMGAKLELRVDAEGVMFHSYEAPVHRALIALR